YGRGPVDAVCRNRPKIQRNVEERGDDPKHYHAHWKAAAIEILHQNTLQPEKEDARSKEQDCSACRSKGLSKEKHHHQPHGHSQDQKDGNESHAGCGCCPYCEKSFLTFILNSGKFRKQQRGDGDRKHEDEVSQISSNRINSCRPLAEHVSNHQQIDSDDKESKQTGQIYLPAHLQVLTKAGD